MKKILFFINKLSGGGAEKALVNLVNNMDKNEFDITVLTLFGGEVYDNQLAPQIKYKCIFKKYIKGLTKYFKYLSPKLLHKLFIKDKFDIEVSFLEGITARVISGCPFEDIKKVSWIHIQQFDIKNASRQFWSKREYKNSYKKFDKVVCVSSSVKQDFLNIFGENIDTTVLHNVLVFDDIHNKSAEQVESTLFDDNEIKYCTVARLVKSKNTDALIRVHNRLIQEGKNVHLYIIGDGVERSNLEQYILTNNLQKSCTILGFKSNPYKYVSRCDFFVNPSLNEGYSTVLLEAIVLGLPIVATDTAGTREILGQNNEFGIVVQKTEEDIYLGIKSLLDDPQTYQKYKQKSVERSAEIIAEPVLKQIQKMLQNL